jgi:hypothetical protein
MLPLTVTDTRQKTGSITKQCRLLHERASNTCSNLSRLSEGKPDLQIAGTHTIKAQAVYSATPAAGIISKSQQHQQAHTRI